MALDYYLEIREYGTQEKLLKLRDLILAEFVLIDHEETKIMTAPGVGISLFIDEDEFGCDNKLDYSRVPDLIIGFRIDKFKLQTKGYELLRRVVQKILDTIDTDLRLTDEDNNDIFLTRESGIMKKMLLDHDIWRVGVNP